MEQNTDRMWWTIGLIVLGGLLISGLVMIASTNVMPQISEKANALIKKADPDVTHTAYANNAVGLDVLNLTNWEKNDAMSNSTYKVASNGDGSFKVTGKGTNDWETLSKSFPAKVGDKLRFTVHYTNHQDFGLYANNGLKFNVSSNYISNHQTIESNVVLSNTITNSTEYQLEYTAKTNNVWMQLNFGGISDDSQVDFDIKIEVENLTNPVK